MSVSVSLVSALLCQGPRGGGSKISFGAFGASPECRLTALT